MQINKTTIGIGITALIIGAGAMILTPASGQTISTTVDKVSETEVKITTTIPEQISEQIVSLETAKNELTQVTNQISMLVNSKANDMKRYDDAIKTLDEKKTYLEGIIADAESQGVKVVAPVTEVVTP